MLPRQFRFDLRANPQFFAVARRTRGSFFSILATTQAKLDQLILTNVGNGRDQTFPLHRATCEERLGRAYTSQGSGSDENERGPADRALVSVESGTSGHPQFAIIVSKKDFQTSVARHQIKRQVSELIYQAIKTTPSPAPLRVVVLVFRPPATPSQAQELSTAIQTILKHK